MKNINGKWVVSLAFEDRLTAENFRYMLSDGVCISPNGARTKSFTEIDLGEDSANAIDSIDRVAGKRVR